MKAALRLGRVLIGALNRILSRLFIITLRKKKLLLGLVLNPDKFSDSEIRRIHDAYNNYFTQDDYVCLINAHGAGVFEEKNGFELVELRPSDFDEDGPHEYWRLLLKVVNRNAPSRYFYENLESVEHYEAKGLFEKNGVSLFKVDDYIFIKWLEQRGHRRLLDLGCGSGAFYYLLSTSNTGIRYHGFDYSKAQIDAALRTYPEISFDVRDASQIDIATFNQFDAIHAWSVFAFMPKERALKTMNTIIASTSDAFLTISCTKRAEDFVRDEHISIRSGDTYQGCQNVAIDYYPYIEDLLEINSRYGNKYRFEIEEVWHGRQWHPDFQLSLLSFRFFGAASRFVFRICNRLLSRQYKYLRVRMYPARDHELLDGLFHEFSRIDHSEFVELLSR